MDKRVFKRVMSSNGTIYQYPNQLVVSDNHKFRRPPEPVECGIVTLAKSSDEPNETNKMLNNNKTPLTFTTNTSTNYKRNEFRQYYDPKEASVEDSTRIRKKSFNYNPSLAKDHRLPSTRRNMTPPINYKTNQSSSNSSSSPQSSAFSQPPPPQSQPPPMQYGAIYPTGNLQPMYHPQYHQGYIAASNPANNDSHQQIHGENVPNSQSNITRGGGRGMNRRGGGGGGRNRGAGANINNGNMNSRRQNNEYRQNNNQQSALNQNSMNSNDYNLIDHHQTVLNSSHYPVYFTHYPYVPSSAIPATAQNLTGQPLFALQQQPIFINPYGHPYHPVVYNYMPPQMPPIQSDVIDSDQTQDVSATSPAAVYQAIPPPYQLAYPTEHHHFELCEPPLAGGDRIEFQGSVPEEEYQLQMMSPADEYAVESNEVPNVENHDVVPLAVYTDNEIQSDNQSIVFDQNELIDKTRDLIIQATPADMNDMQRQYLDDKIMTDDETTATSLQFINDSEESNIIEQEHLQQQLLMLQQPPPPLQQQPHQQQQHVQNRKPTNFVPIPSNPLNIATVKKQTASVSVSAIPNKLYEEVKMNEYISEQQQQIHPHSQQQPQTNDVANQNMNKNSFSSITASKHSPKSLKDEKKTEIIKQNDSQKTTLSEQAKQQIASTISNSEPSTLSASNKKDKMETAGPTIIANSNPMEKDSKFASTSPSTTSSSSPSERSAQAVKQTNSVPPSWADLFQSGGSAPSSASNQIKKTLSTDISNSSQSNNKLPGTMSYSAVSQSANNKMKPNTASIATSTSSSISNNNEASNAVDAPKPTPVDQNALKLGDFFSKYKTDFGSVSLVPRGMLNKSNYCYINAILQALVACPPFFHLIKAIPHTPLYYKANSKSPVTDAMVELVSNFSSNNKKPIQREIKKKDEVPDIARDTSFEPRVILNMLKAQRNELFPIEGRQEDAEEFLSFILNKMNDEMIELKKLVTKPKEEETDDLNGNLETSENEEEWQVISGARNKSSITRTTDYGRSPISDIFGGKLRLRVHREGDHSSDNIEPFFTLKLSIERASSVKDALDLLVGKDQLEGVTCTKTNQEISAWQQVTLEELPVVLILHLKCFDFKKEGCTKILKTFEFPIELKLDQKLLASKNKYQAKQKQYKLFAVVYHDGKDASKGHYVSDIWNGAHSTWIRYDDSTVKPVTDYHVLHPKTQSSHRVPYLLFYRRHDTIGGGKKQGA